MPREIYLHALATGCRRLWLVGLLLAPMAVAAPRVWTSSDGKTVTAELIDATETTVTIKSGGDREYTVPHERFSQADRDVIQAYLAQKKADYEQMDWPRPTAEEAIKAAHFKRLHAVDAKRHTDLYAGRMLAIEGQVLDVREDRMSSTQGFIVVIDTEDRVPIEFRFLKANYEKDLSLLLGTEYNRYRGPYGEDAFRFLVADKNLTVERRYVVSRESTYNYNVGSFRYRYKWSNWEVVSAPVSRGETIRLRGEFISVFNSAMSFKDARLLDPPTAPIRRTIITY